MYSAANRSHCQSQGRLMTIDCSSSPLNNNKCRTALGQGEFPRPEDGHEQGLNSEPRSRYCYPLTDSGQVNALLRVLPRSNKAMRQLQVDTGQGSGQFELQEVC